MVSRFARRALSKILMGAVLSISLSCSSTAKSESRYDDVSALSEDSREPASLSSEELEARYQSMLKAEFPGKEISSEVRRLAEIFYYSENLIRTYDQKLDAWANDTAVSHATEMNIDPTYIELLAARILTEVSLETLNFYATRNLETMFAPEGEVSEEDRASAKRMSADFKKSLRRQGRATDKLAFQKLVSELYELQSEFYQQHKAQKSGNQVSKTPLVDSAVDPELSTSEKILKFYESNKWTLDQAVADFSKAPSIQSEIALLTPSIREGLLSSFDQRTPQSNGSIAPGAGSSGNMNGSNFKNGRWALTYDDGPSSVYTPAVLSNLRKRGLKATFFQVAKNVAALPSVTRSVRDAGHALGNHSYTHAQLTKLGTSGLKKEIDESTALETRYFGFKPKIFRCPYGSCGPNGSLIRKKIAAQGMVHVAWNVDSLDWQDKNASSVYRRIKKQMSVQGGGIILVHDIHPQTVEATRMLMDDFVKGQKNGSMRVLTIPQAIKEINEGGMQ